MGVEMAHQEKMKDAPPGFWHKAIDHTTTVRDLLNQCDEDGIHIYELTSRIHGDIDYYYEVQVPVDMSGLVIACAKRPQHADRMLSPHLDGEQYSLEEFVDLVNKDREEINQRLKPGLRRIDLLHVGDFGK